MTGLVDIHTHVLPELDDGPPDLDEAIAFARAAQQSGVSTLVATPHLRSDFPGVRVTELGARCQAMRDVLRREAIELDLVTGAEVSLAWALDASAEELRLASFGQRGTDVLIETPGFPVAGLGELLFQVRGRGLRVTLAHPERSAAFQADSGQLADLVRQGVLLQVNASSLLAGGRRSPLHRLATALCGEGLAHAIASDGHRAASWRPVTELSQAADAVAALVGPARARWLMSDAPAAIIEGAELPDPPAIEQRSPVWRRFRRR